MVEGVNVFAADIRNKVRREVDFLPGAWVEFYDDVTIDQLQKAQEVKKNANLLDGIDLVLSQIASWNFADETGKILEINKVNLGRLGSKLLRWLINAQASIINPEAEDPKKKV